MHEALTIGVEGIDSFKNKAFSPFQLPGPLSRTNSSFLSAGGVLRSELPSPTPPACIPAAPPRPRAVFVNRGQCPGAAGAGLGTGGLGGKAGNRLTSEGPAPGKGDEEVLGSLSPSFSS